MLVYQVVRSFGTRKIAHFIGSDSKRYKNVVDGESDLGLFASLTLAEKYINSIINEIKDSLTNSDELDITVQTIDENTEQLDDDEEVMCQKAIITIIDYQTGTRTWDEYWIHVRKIEGA